ncbi:MAG: hypothetical protein KDA95_12025 [Acidimicrobiales bacterium]|nr:hypothetical protein [Acidimicrobiales bacterium]
MSIIISADARARGFLLGATAGRTTLMGEGLQHQDGHSLLHASTVPACQAYDPAFAYETAEIIRHGIHRMYGPNPQDVFYYLALYNENYLMPSLPDGPDVVEGIIAGLYRWAEAPRLDGPRATLLFSGSSQGAVRHAATELAERWGVAAELWSATSYKALRENALEAERWNRLHPTSEPRKARVTDLLERSQGPIIATTDFMKTVPDQISRWIPQGRSYTSLGTDGFGRSDTREALRRYFEVDAAHVVVATLSSLAQQGSITPAVVDEAISHYSIDPEAIVPWHN